MLEKSRAASTEVALNEKILEKIKYIPKVIAIELCRISKKTAEELIEDIEVRLIPDSEIFIKLFIEDKFYNLSEERKKLLQEYYIAWKLYESLENEKISEDKRDTLYKLLEQIKGSTIDNKNNNSYLNDNRYGKIFVFGG